MKIFFSNIGYARGIDGSLRQHVSRFGRHFYCALPVQEQVLRQVKDIIAAEDPDICCFVEIDTGSFFTAYMNQIEALIDETYPFYDISTKYGETGLPRYLPLHGGKSNAFMAKQPCPFERVYFTHGTKKLIYRVELAGGVTLLFAHFSLRYATRQLQLAQLRALTQSIDNDVIVMADFNILRGFSELDYLLGDDDLCLLNRPDEHTFMFHRRRMVLDLCVCSKRLAPRVTLRIIPQPFSDHDALLATIDG